MNDPLNRDLIRPQRYWYVDGLSEIAGGFVIFLIGLINAICAVLPAIPLRAWVMGLGQPLLVVAAGFAVRPVVRMLKEQITYPRTGYVEYSGRGRSARWQRFFSVFFIAFSFSALGAMFGDLIPDRYSPMTMATALALVLAYLGARLGLRRFYLVAALTVFVGSATILLDLVDPWPLALLFGSEGLFWIISGALVLTNYLKNTQPVGEEQTNA